MMFSLIPLLLAEPDLSPRTIDALRLAESASSRDRQRFLERAAWILACDAHIETADARELVGLTDF